MIPSLRFLADDIALAAVYETDDEPTGESRLLAQGWETQQQQTFLEEGKRSNGQNVSCSFIPLPWPKAAIVVWTIGSNPPPGNCYA